MKWRFGKLERNPKAEEGLSLERVQDADIGLHKWQLEEKESELAKAKEINGIDHLTGARNRQDFDKELETALKIIRGELPEHRAGASEVMREVSLILIDADHFKSINDTYGHPVGDAVLKEIARILRESIRDVDMAARWGGEEFAVLLKGVDIELAKRKAEELRTKISELAFPEHPDLKVTASFGVISSVTSTDEHELLKFADDALYLAKKRGRNRVEVV